MNSHTTSQVHMHKHLCWIGRGTHIRGTQHDNKLQHGHTQQDINGTVITCVHTCHLWDSHVFTLFVWGMQRIHKHKKVGCALTESLGSRAYRVETQQGTRGRDCHCFVLLKKKVIRTYSYIFAHIRTFSCIFVLKKKPSPGDLPSPKSFRGCG